MSTSLSPKIRGRLIGPAFDSSQREFASFPRGVARGALAQPVSATELWRILRNSLDNAGHARCDLRPDDFFDDDCYYLPTFPELKALITAPQLTAGFGRISNIFDCDDFAYNFRGFTAAHRFRSEELPPATIPLALGMAWGSGFKGLGLGMADHVVNLVVMDDLRIRIVDTTPSQKNSDPALLERGFVEQLHYVVI